MFQQLWFLAFFRCLLIWVTLFNPQEKIVLILLSMSSDISSWLIDSPVSSESEYINTVQPIDIIIVSSFIALSSIDRLSGNRISNNWTINQKWNICRIYQPIECIFSFLLLTRNNIEWTPPKKSRISWEILGTLLIIHD